MKNELQRHKTSDKIKWAITGICFVLVFAFIAGICMQLFADDKYKPSEWFKPVEQAQPDMGDETSDLHNHMHALSASSDEDPDADIEPYVIGGGGGSSTFEICPYCGVGGTLT